MIGLLVAAVVMLVGAVVARVIAVDAKNTSLEDVAPPLAVEAARSAEAAGPERRR